MATHFSILAWKIPWTEELGGLQAMGSQRLYMTEATNTFSLQPYDARESMFWKFYLWWRGPLCKYFRNTFLYVIGGGLFLLFLRSRDVLKHWFHLFSSSWHYFSFFLLLLRTNSHNVKWITLMVYNSENFSWVTTTPVKFQNIFITPQKR